MNPFITRAIVVVTACLPAVVEAAGPVVEAAVSVRLHEAGAYGLDLLASAVEPRAGGVARLEVAFDADLDPGTVEGHIVVRDETGAQHPGFTWELEGAVLTLLFEPGLSEHCFAIDFAGLESTAGEVTDAAIEFVVLAGDVTGDGIVNSVDYSSVKPWYGASVDAETFLYDLTLSDPVINAIDGSFVKPRFGHTVFCPSDEATATELAGNSLEEYPFFEYVRAFNENATVELAIDPTRFPAIVDRTCDIYVANAKTADEWAADPTLTDATPDGPQTQAFGGTTIQENTFEVAQPYDLDADAGLGLGVGYDVVLDCDGDGRLGGGDYIDGLGDEAGLYAVHDATQPGPLATTVIEYSGGGWLGQRTWYPTELDEMGEVPLVVISHGHGHHYTWYDYLQEHLASYGYVVMSHENNTGGGYYGAATTTLTNTDYFLGNLATIGGGVFDGHIDSQRMTWIGHSRGGEGICQAYDLIHDGAWTPEHFVLEDIALISPIAPPDVTGVNSNHPHGANYHLLYGSADGDVWGCAASQHQPFRQLERATGFKGSTYVHGADHNDFNCCGWDNFWGPEDTEIGREEAQRVARALYVALIQHYVEGSLPAKDFLWRQHERFHSIGVADDTILVNEYKDGPAAGNFIIDDYETEPSATVSSCGGSVSFDVLNLTEGKLKDANTTFTWMASDPMNGMTRAGSQDTANGVVFDWTVGGDHFYEYGIPAGARDFTEYVYLSFHACQGTRHPETTAELGDLTFTVTLRDAMDAISSIHIAAYGGGIEETYQREGCGDETPGWMNEFETVRIRLTDFLTNGTGLDLSDVVAVRFEFGADHGSARGRLGLDDVELTGE